MAITRMSYILIKKDICNESIKKICKEILESICETVEEDSLELAYNDRLICIDYRINQKSNSDRSYLELIAKDRENANICVLEKIDKALKTTDKQKFFSLISNYDGISEYYGKRLYPKYAEFERLLREFILIILTKSYGIDWFTETATEGVKKNVKERAKGSKNIIEHMDYSNMEMFLFEKHKPDVEKMFENDLSVEKIQSMNEEEVKAAIEKNRPKSLWEMEFSEYGLAEKWERDFHVIHTTRNNVAHNKTIDNKEFK